MVQTSPEMEDQARTLLRALHERNVKIDPLLMLPLEYAAASAWQGQLAQVEAAIGAATMAVQRFDRETQAAQAEAERRPWLVVHAPFRGPRGQEFSAGRQRVDPAVAEELKQWAVRVEAGSRGRTLASIGHPTWPVFSVENAQP